MLTFGAKGMFLNLIVKIAPHAESRLGIPL